MKFILYLNSDDSIILFSFDLSFLLIMFCSLESLVLIVNLEHVERFIPIRFTDKYDMCVIEFSFGDNTAFLIITMIIKGK